jgi:hypothetical protein
MTLGFGPWMVGCVQPRYVYGIGGGSSDPMSSTVSVQRGRHHPTLDAIESAIHFPARKLGQLLDDPCEYTVSAETKRRAVAVRSATGYLSENGLGSVNVEVRRYGPSEQWQRLRANRRMHWAWKYTDGARRHVVTTLFPGRVYHVDYYNPYTNTLSINSDSSASALLAAAEVKQSLGSEKPGFLAFSQTLPVFPIRNQSLVASDALTYASEKGDRELLGELYPLAYASIGGSGVSEVLSLAPDVGIGPQIAADVAGSGIGHLIGVQKANHSDR